MVFYLICLWKMMVWFLLAMIRNLSYFFILVSSFSPVAWMISEYSSKSIFLPPGVIFSIIGLVILLVKISSNQRIYLNYSILFAFLIMSFFISIFSYALSIGHISYDPFVSVVKYLYPMFSFS
jgi:hypothetical protein